MNLLTTRCIEGPHGERNWARCPPVLEEELGEGVPSGTRKEDQQLLKEENQETKMKDQSPAAQEVGVLLRKLETKLSEANTHLLREMKQTTSTVGRTSQKSLDTSVLKEETLDKESNDLPKLGSAGGHYKTIRSDGMDKIVQGIWHSGPISKWKAWKIFFRKTGKMKGKGPHGNKIWKYLDPAIGGLKKSITEFSSEEKDLLWKRVRNVPRCGGIFGGSERHKRLFCGTQAKGKFKGNHNCGHKGNPNGEDFCQHGTLDNPERVLGRTLEWEKVKISNKKNFPVVYEKRMSWAVPGVQREFLVMNFSGRATPDQYGMYWLRTEACKIQYYNYLATCSNCCCTGGYIQTESKAFNVSPKGHNCDTWFLKATSFAAMFFGLQRKDAMVDVQTRCLCNSTACIAEQAC